jgi:hypothetical protein
MKNGIFTNYGRLWLSFLLACLMCCLSPAAQARQDRKVSDVSGRWVGKFPVSEEHTVSDAENPVAVEVLVKNDAGSLSGTAVFYVIRNKDNKPQVVGKTESDLIDPQFDGTTLKFSVKSKGQQPGTTTKVEMRMKIISDTEAELENVEDNSGPVFKMKKTQLIPPGVGRSNPGILIEKWAGAFTNRSQRHHV